MNDNKKSHWEHIYDVKTPGEVSWTQEKPETSLNFIHSFGTDKTAKIIDIGGGDSKLVDFLLEEGYENISVLDISANALERAKNRLGNKAEKVTWIVADITEFEPTEQYDIWHDRAVFHFLTEENDIKKYQDLVAKAVKEKMVIGTFSTNGPLKCSGLEIKQNDETSLTSNFEANFEKIECFTIDHKTPFDTIQNFIFCSFNKK
ncbi:MULTISPECIES: class I SAM-dependent methyltransferase [Empedobacter]|uniref:class I SAM-dependent methyltransferase n=1 Tax=Empedobacter TaxID=59734 RepID=UPI00257766CE|nr:MULTISPECIES: class I SAM-dependent methyltransferase [Empedobacter]MDM1040813.1 class I SAM-dependent methyltransferase [Empedobacter brevis]MDM1134394.1 class I SAM-dependent methyltransferase [Empedobacter sp. R750]